jgi:hypothetical protein
VAGVIRGGVWCDVLWHGLLTVPRGSTEGLTAAREIVANNRRPAPGEATRTRIGATTETYASNTPKLR